MTSFQGEFVLWETCLYIFSAHIQISPHYCSVLQLVYDPLPDSGGLDPVDFLSTLSLTNFRVRFLRFGSADPPVSYYSAYDVQVEGACICDGAIAFPEVGVACLETVHLLYTRQPC